ncbi:MAG: CHASE3 domain-containing protein [Acidobacteriaceae bacterium]|nr:CHASE3 domain-containing protein [Acidobacteriaceae bacterium]MBV9502186.1 CHASE3 domain-containing protein [Acidobacteriaceae bacterium]
MTLSDQTKTRRRLALLFSVPLAFSLLFFLVSIAEEHTDTQLLKIQGLTLSVDQLRALATDAESGERGFLLTDEKQYLLPLDQAINDLKPQIQRCRDLEPDNSALRTQLENVASLVTQRVNEANHVVATAQQTGKRAALLAMRSGKSEVTMNQIRQSVNRVADLLNDVKNEYVEKEKRNERLAFGFFMGGSITTLLVTVWLYNAVLTYLRERDMAQLEVQRANEELERRIDERTQELQHMNEELQQFAYVASHDLQEPLRTITSFSQLLESRYKNRLDEDADEFIGFIVTASRRMTDLINGLLAVVRLRKTGQPVAPVPLQTLLNEAEASLQAAIRDADASVEHGPLPALVVDRVQFSQVFQNLISNSIKYRSAEAPRIRVNAKRDGSNWIISLADNGRGFNQAYAERIFGLFQRLHAREVEGTGMGLSIVRKIVERHGGRIWAESQEGVGSTFYISLPVSLERLRIDQSEPVQSTAARA